MAYAEYPIEHMDIRSLHLDVSNYRFAADQPSEMAALNYLWAEQQVSEVAELILRDGYVDIEQPLIVNENGRYIVLEGNRRVSALMALNDPSLAPAHQADIERLLRRFALEAEDIPQSIRVMVLPSRAAAASILARLHIGVSKKRWDLDEQAKFVIAQLGEDMTVEQLSAMLPGIESVPRVVRMGRIREALRATKYTDESLARYARGSRLKMSSFEYAYRQTAIQDLIGLKFDGQAQVISWAHTPTQLFALERLLNGFKSGELNTRRGLKPDTTAYKLLLAEMLKTDQEVAIPVNGHKPAVASNVAGVDQSDSPAVGASSLGITPGTVTPPSSAPDSETVPGTGSDAHQSSTKSDAEDATGSKLRGPNDPLLRANLTLTGIDEPAHPLTMQRRLRELRRINVVEFPSAAAMLMRSVLEASVKEHYGQSNGIDAVGELGAVMRQVKTDYGRNGQLSNAINNITRFGNDATHVPGTGRWFNMITHSVNVDVNGQHVQQAWLVVLPLVRFLLNEPPRSA
ncbi:hypothetical protein C3B61_15740 [Cryobacterium zongtaii]|uniref:Uncharacterized protein n=1 Tax=Cryobacterium zongtaii TaxID=1259217 RepID=A0A2S3Z9V4_9MICO|nr:DUF4145 domain-containing protein [Cryobacterium zongtaii]POH62330.1 hypothetical protein C3B61_15740 [Cryobacterium zongtaii]